MKTQSDFTEKMKKGSYDKELDKLQDLDLFPEKTALARAILTKTKIPSHKSRSLDNTAS